jgi:mRNA interferase MazF
LTKRGEVWTASGGDYAGKPRPVIVVQNDAFSDLQSISVCPLTTDDPISPLFRIAIPPTPANGLRELSYAMADKLTTMPRAKLGKPIGLLDRDVLEEVDMAIVLFLDLGKGA